MRFEAQDAFDGKRVGMEVEGKGKGRGR